MQIAADIIRSILAYLGKYDAVKTWIDALSNWLVSATAIQRENAILISLSIVLIFILAISIFLCVYQRKKNRRVTLHEAYILEDLVHTILHQVRDDHYAIDKKYWQYENHKKYNEEEMVVEIHQCLVSHLNTLADKLSEYYGMDISACIKVFTNDDTDIENLKFYALYRSFNTEGDRQGHNSKKHPAKIGDTSYYRLIMENKSNFFASGNLRMDTILSRIKAFFAHKNVYALTNSHTDYWRHYKSTIIVPIRLKHDFQRFPQKRWKEYDFEILGFLCIDAPKRLKSWKIKKWGRYSSKNRDVWLVYLLAQVADTLFWYLENALSNKKRVFEYGIVKTAIAETTSAGKSPVASQRVKRNGGSGTEVVRNSQNPQAKKTIAEANTEYHALVAEYLAMM